MNQRQRILCIPNSVFPSGCIPCSCAMVSEPGSPQLSCVQEALCHFITWLTTVVMAIWSCSISTASQG